MTNIVPPPWRLSGQGYILAYRFTPAFVRQAAFTPSFLQGRFRPSFGFVMLVNYEYSNVGPYGELLFIPGKFNHYTGAFYSITKIYVDSETSLLSGRANWGIPKEPALFLFEKINPNTTRVEVSADGHSFFEATLQSKGWQFPFSTNLLKIPLVQELNGQGYHVRFRGRGQGRFVRLLRLAVDDRYFPNIAQFKPLAVIEVQNFNIEFLPAKTFRAASATERQ